MTGPGAAARRRGVVLALAVCGLWAGAQQAATAPGIAAANGSAVAVPASYVIGVNDVLAMTVFGDKELTAPAMRVDANGTIHTPYGKTPVHVAGLTVGGARKAIAAELVRDQLARNPDVDVQVVQVDSHPIVISGLGVRQPGTIQAVQPIRLLDALNEAGGLTDSDADVVVIRPGPNGGHTQERISVARMLNGTDAADNPWLRGGEQVRVMPGGNAYLSGAVQLPGAYPLSDTNPLTVRKVMALAHGLAPAAEAKQTQLIRNVGAADQTTTIINLPAILNGKAPDIPLAANDMIYVPVSGVKKAGLEAVSRTLTILTVAASQMLVLR